VNGQDVGEDEEAVPRAPAAVSRDRPCMQAPMQQDATVASGLI